MYRRHYLVFVLQSAILLFVQAMILNHLLVFGYLAPILYLYPLLKLPFQTPRWIVVLLGALLGFLMDLFMNTPGLNLASATLVAYLRAPILLSLSEEEVMDEEHLHTKPSFHSLTILRHLGYLLLLALLHTTSLFLVEAFSVQLYSHLLPHIIGSTLMTFVIFVIFEVLSLQGRKR